MESFKDKEKIAVSACLTGVNCKYNGQNNYCKQVVEFLRNYTVVEICPEVLGGLSCPRSPAEIVGGKVIDRQAKDVTENFTDGAKKALSIVKANGCKKAILKSRSPSCGKGMVYDGSFSGKLINKNGITADLFIKNGITVLTEEEIKQSVGE